MEFGDRVFVSAKLTRFQDFRRGFDAISKREWQRLKFLNPRKALYVGYRTLANGYMEDVHGYEEWIPKKYIRVALVIFNERENPVYAFFEDVEKLEVPLDRRCTAHSVRTGERCKNTVDMEITAVFKDGLTRL